MPSQLKHEDLAAVRPSERAPFTAAFDGDQAAAAFADRHPSNGGKTITPDAIAALRFANEGKAR